MQSGNLTRCLRSSYPEHSYLLFCQLVKGYLTLFCVILGTVGNLHGIKSIHLLNFDKNRGVVLAASIIALAFWDTILLWCAIFYYSIGALLRPYNIEMPSMVIPWFQGCAQISLTASVWCVAAITVQRWWASRDPFCGSRSSRVLLNPTRVERRNSSVSTVYCFTYRRHFRMPILLSSLAVIVNLPAFFELTSIPCYFENGNHGTMLIQWLRGNDAYKLWYRVGFRSIVTTIGPNIFIFTITLWTVYLIRGSSRSRRRLFQMADILFDRYASKETIQTVVSVMLATKFLFLRMPLFVLDVMEIIGVWNDSFMYASDISNFLVVVNSATNCVIYLKAASWLEHRAERKSTTIKKKNAYETIQGTKRIELLQNSWNKVKANSCGNFGARIIYAVLSRNPSLIDLIADSERIPLSTSIADEDFTEEENPEELAANFLSSPRIHQLGDHISKFIEELLHLMETFEDEEEIVFRIRQAAVVHTSRNIVFSSSVWRDFKNTFLEFIGECSFDSEAKRKETIAAWNSFASMLIREMKNAFWSAEDGQPVASSSFRRCSMMFNIGP